MTTHAASQAPEASSRMHSLTSTLIKGLERLVRGEEEARTRYSRLLRMAVAVVPRNPRLMKDLHQAGSPKKVSPAKISGWSTLMLVMRVTRKAETVTRIYRLKRKLLRLNPQNTSLILRQEIL